MEHTRVRTFGDETKASKRRLSDGFRRRRKAQIELSDTKKKEKYDVVAALAKALLIFMTSYGAVGGFLNAYALEFNKMLCVMALFALSLILSAVYETGKKWITNLFVIGVFIIYAYVALKQFMVLNSGAYAVINEVYEAAQNYLGVAGGGLYNLSVDDTYRTVTAIALFVGVVIEVLMVIRLQYKASLIRTLFLTFTLYLVPIYFEKSPDLLCLFMLLSGYATIGIIQFGRVKKTISKQIKQTLPVGMAAAAVAVLLLGVLFPKVRYQAIVPKNPAKEATEGAAIVYAQYGIMALFMNNGAGGGLNEGRLSQNTMMMPTDETHLIVRYTPYSAEPVYLKAFTGLDYDGSSWSKATEILGEEADKMRQTSEGRKEAYGEDPQRQPMGVMEVYNLSAKTYEYRPYYVDLEQTEHVAPKEYPDELWEKYGDAIRAAGEDVFQERTNFGMRYEYYPAVRDDKVKRENEDVSQRYLEVPNVCRRAVANFCQTAGLSGDKETVIEQVRAYFEENYSYTLRPGYYFGGMDYVSYFLSRNKKGYCTHFASAGTLILRYMGIPARYVEGYVFSFSDVTSEGEIIEDAEYKDYYDGYSPLGETALVELEIPDGQAHAWIEAYLEDYGWIVVDVTPTFSGDDEDGGSFWDAILGAGGQGDLNEQNQQNVAEALENALAGGMGVLFALAIAIAAFFIGRRELRKYRESKLPGRERVMLEYSRMTAWLKERDEDFLTLTTPKEELEYVGTIRGTTASEELRGELYDVFFGPEKERDYETLRKRVLTLFKEVKKGWRSTKQGRS